MGKGRLDEEGFSSMSVETEREHKRGRKSVHGFSISAIVEYFKPYSLQILIGYFILFFMVTYLSIPEADLIELKTPDSLVKLSSRTVSVSFPFLTDLRAKVHSAEELAISKLAVFPKKISPEIISDAGVEFVVIKVSSSGTQNAARSVVKPDDPSFVDPLSVKTMASELVVAKFEEILGYDYTLVLNKFNTLPDHVLILTNEFKMQQLPLSHHDFAVWYLTLTAMNGVGFYNSNGVAGASQPHKHLQVVPNDVLWHIRGQDASYPIPLDNFIRPRIQEKVFIPLPAFRRLQKSAIKKRIYRIPEFPFEHALVVFSDRLSKTKEELVQFVGEYLENIYNSLLLETGIDRNTLVNCAEKSESELSDAECAIQSAYNLILTDSYMFVAPRSVLKFNENINGLGFMGLLLANSKESEDVLRKVGPIAALAAVGHP